jgi:hypothetical protein
MKSFISGIAIKEIAKTGILDAVALTFIFLAPAIAHLISFPVYMIEPMRLMMVLSLAHSSQRNSYILALCLPLFSFIVSGHPEFVKMLIITTELVLNVFLFYWLFKKSGNAFLSLLPAILLSKIASYLMYFLFFSLAFVKAEAETDFLLVQVATTIAFSSYIFLFGKKPNPRTT